MKHYQIDDLLEDTFPAEGEWITRLDPYVRAAALYAYQKTILNLHEIFDRREDESTENISTEQRRAVERGLEELRLIAWEKGQLSLEDLDQLTDLANIDEQPFRSRLPLVGPVFAGFRELWSRVAAKEFARPLIDQQKAINRVNAEELAEVRELRAARDDQKMDSDHLLSDLIRDLQSANETLEKLTLRLDRLEETVEDEGGETAQ